MTSFRDDDQLDRVIAALLGPRLDARIYVSASGAIVATGPLTAHDKTIVALANALLGIDIVVYANDVVQLPPEQLSRFGSLLVAMGNGADDVDEWLAMFESNAK